jgi:hypothetical protein
VLAERAACEGPRSTRAPEVSPFHPATSWGREKKITEKTLWGGSEGKVSQPGHPFAPGTRTMKQCSFDGRSRDSPGCKTVT